MNRSACVYTLPVAFGLLVAVGPAMAQTGQEFGYRVNYDFAVDARSNNKLEALVSVYDNDLPKDALDFSGKVQINDCDKGQGQTCFTHLILQGAFSDLLGSVEEAQLTFWGEYTGLTPDNIAGGSGKKGDPHKFKDVQIVWPYEDRSLQQSVDVWFLPDGGTRQQDPGQGRIEFQLRTGYVPLSTCFSEAGSATSTRVETGQTCVVSVEVKEGGADSINRNQGFTYLLLEPRSTLQVGLDDSGDVSDFLISGSAGFRFELDGGHIRVGGSGQNGVDATGLDGLLVLEAEELNGYQPSVDLHHYIGSNGADEIFLADHTRFSVATVVDLANGRNEIDVLDRSRFEASQLKSTGSLFLYNGAFGDQISGEAAGVYLGAISLGAGSDEIDNLGDFSVDGKVSLGAGKDRLFNFAGHSFSAAALDLGAGDDLLENAGIMTITSGIVNPGGEDSIYNSLGLLRVGFIEDRLGARTSLNVESGIVEFTQSGSDFHQAVVSSLGAIDLGGHSVKTSVVLQGGNGAGSVPEIMENTAKLQNGSLIGTITSDGGLLSGVSRADLVVRSGRTFVREMASGASLGSVIVGEGQLWAADDQSVTVAELILQSPSFEPVDRPTSGLSESIQPGLVLGFDHLSRPALIVKDSLSYLHGNLYLYKPAEESAVAYEGIWSVMEFADDALSASEYQALFANTYLMYEKPEGGFSYFGFLESGAQENPEDTIRVVALAKGSLKVCVAGAFEDGCGQRYQGRDPHDIEKDLEHEVSGGSTSHGSVGHGGGGLNFDDGGIQAIAEEFGSWTPADVIEVVKRGLLPRNVDGAGQTLATYNNLLADTIFERTTMRQFTEVEPEVAVEPTPEPEVVPAGEPVRGLWAKSGEVDEAEANAYLDEATATPQPLVVADAHTAADHQDEYLIEINGKTYAENQSLTAEYAERDGVRGWFRGFGGQSADSNGESGTLFNHYAISSGGGVVGVDVSLSESFQIGAYANYGNINLWQRNGVEGLSGSWEADGWGGGITADYWTNNFYVQGLIGGTGFSGEQKRSIKGYGTLFDGETASGEKSAGSMVGALRVGAPFQSGSTYFEPQFTATWTGNSENRFSESADDDRLGLTFKSRNTNYLQTALGMKLAWPMKTGTTGLLTPSVKVAWLGDWNQNNEDQRIGFDFTDKAYAVSSNQEDVNGALLEAGLDYSVAQVEGTTVKAYVRGGAEMWGGSRGTQWRASGGVTFQF